MEGKNNKLIKFCWWIFTCALIISIITTFKACPFSADTQFDRDSAWTYLHDLAIGVFCSAVLVIFVEKYHHNKDIKEIEKNRIILLNDLLKSIEENYINTCTRASIISLYSGREYEEGGDFYAKSINLEKKFLLENKGKWTHGKFFFVSEEIYYELLLKSTTEEELQTSEKKEHILLVQLYIESRSNIQKLRNIFSKEQLSSYKVLNILKEKEYEAIKRLYSKIDELFLYLDKSPVNTNKSIEKYNIVLDELSKNYRVFKMDENSQ